MLQALIFVWNMTDYMIIFVQLYDFDLFISSWILKFKISPDFYDVYHRYLLILGTKTNGSA